ncbi:MAG: hypothetical protein HYU80_02895 [Candidatus Blackburnbacteria bacterium]|nr:hypothetical protein [Candidatus Blackburnbacteria bacterium]
MRLLTAARILIFNTFFLLVACLLPITVSAQQEFKTEYQTVYTVLENGDAQVSQDITLTNNFSTIYATSYTLSLESKKPEKIEAYSGKRIFETNTEEIDQITKITISFPDSLVGRGKSRTFTVKYTIPALASQNGQVWELAVPRLASPELLDSYNLTLRVPGKFGKLAYVSPNAKEEGLADGFRTFFFEKDSLSRAGVVAAFGDFQVFSFQINYHLQNPFKDRLGKTSIVLVPDTAFQKVYYETLDPKPESIELDEDGNWVATYYIEAEEKITVNARGSVQIFATPQEHYMNVDPKSKPYYLSEGNYWEVNDPEIVKIAKDFRSTREIYDFVVNTLTYDYERVREGVERLGAKRALNSAQNAVCMEFTDLFVALTRAKGIPAREVNGYAYTENPRVQPLSLVADVLHAWPEYWDEDVQIWRPVDPTWGNTTGGVDFFDKFDLSHITFAIHGKNSESPAAAGSYKAPGIPQKDVIVEFGQLPQKRTSTPQIQASSPDVSFPFFPSYLTVKVSNSGPVALYHQKVNISGTIRDLKPVEMSNSSEVEFLAPFTSQILTFSYRASFFAFGKQNQVNAQVGDVAIVYVLPESKNQILGLVLIFGSLCLLALMGAGVVKLWARKRASCASNDHASRTGADSA